MFSAQIIQTGGDDVVVLSRSDYDSLLARAGDPTAEDTMARRILAETKGQTALPAEVMDRLLDGANPMRVLMDLKGMTQADVARLTGLSQPFISKLTRGDVRGRSESIKKLARAFGVGEDVLAGIAS